MGRASFGGRVWDTRGERSDVRPRADDPPSNMSAAHTLDLPARAERHRPRSTGTISNRRDLVGLDMSPRTRLLDAVRVGKVREVREVLTWLAPPKMRPRAASPCETAGDVRCERSGDRACAALRPTPGPRYRFSALAEWPTAGRLRGDAA